MSEAAAGVWVGGLNLINCSDQELTDYRGIYTIIIRWIKEIGAYLSHISKVWRQAVQGLYSSSVLSSETRPLFLLVFPILMCGFLSSWLKNVYGTSQYLAMLSS